MKNILHSLLTTLFIFTALTFVSGQNIVLSQSGENGIYKKGQEVVVKLFLNDRITDTVEVKIRKNYSDQVMPQKIYFKGDTLTLFSESFSEPTSIIFEASTKTETASIGSVVEPGKFKPGMNSPRDLDRFWKSEKKALRALPMNAKLIPVKEKEKGYQCFDVEINCIGPKPARGYFAKPESAKAKSLPIILYFHAAGVKGSWCRSEPDNVTSYLKRGDKALCFDLNAHGMLNGQSEEYYADLEKGELKYYAYQGIESRKDSYFRGMYLRLIRTLDFLTQQPEWDGKRILVIGQSQGGGQALAAAGLDNRVSAVVASIPAMCDWGGKLAGRRSGWPQPLESSDKDRRKMLSSLPYFDTANLLKRSKAKIFAEIGLIDITCPATSVYAAINQAKGEKIIIPVPYRGHGHVPVIYQKIWENGVNKPCEAFIRDYLK